ncbi:MAG TPA: 16S rRNA (guanine(527)-N(7))-methyltransferase RsmG [Nitrospiraceae bacterium]|nr:16S rRNA (guanine(527)-N(7))-methyltransferase RsmG [Nitrospiraceae bacterium]
MEHEDELREFTISSARELGLTIEEAHAEHFIRYLSHLTEWNKTINLTTITEPKEIIIKHFVDSLTALISTDFPQNGVVLDVGSGAGFPGIPLKIVRSDIRLILLEPIQKKCAFINSVIGVLKLQGASTFGGTVEQYASRSITHAIDAIVIRALRYDKIMKHVNKVLNSKGKIVLYRTCPVGKHEIGEEFHLQNETTLTLPGGSGRRVITVIEKTM